MTSQMHKQIGNHSISIHSNIETPQGGVMLNFKSRIFSSHAYNMTSNIRYQY